MTAAYDLRSNAKTKGNRAFLPPQYKVLMHLAYVLFAICLLSTSGYAAWGVWLKWKTDEVKVQLSAVQKKIATQEHMLWLADWRSQSIPMQELMVDFFSQLPEEVRLSQLILSHNSEDGTVDMTIAINSDRNTSAQYFREITSFLQTHGLAIQLLEQNQAVGATVFKAKFRIMKRFDIPKMPPSTAPAQGA
ncbi:MAG: hypothetical protein JW942_01460 [Opitutales bacterium]|nr:hypothetical protein [Opitutales bacterium]